MVGQPAAADGADSVLEQQTFGGAASDDDGHVVLVDDDAVHLKPFMVISTTLFFEAMSCSMNSWVMDWSIWFIWRDLLSVFENSRRCREIQRRDREIDGNLNFRQADDGLVPRGSG